MDPTERKGYYVDKRSVSAGVVSPEYYGYGYLRYTLVKIEGFQAEIRNEHKKQRREE